MHALITLPPQCGNEKELNINKRTEHKDNGMFLFDLRGLSALVVVKFGNFSLACYFIANWISI